MVKRTDIEISTWISSTGDGVAVVAEADEFEPIEIPFDNERGVDGNLVDGAVAMMNRIRVERGIELAARGANTRVGDKPNSRVFTVFSV